MTIIFDLDDTLLDAKKFRDGIALNLGLTPQENELQIDLLFRKRALNYNPNDHIKFLKEAGRIKTATEEKRIRSNLQKFLKKIDNYLFSGVKETLAYLKERGYQLILLTKGNPTFQRAKINNSSIKKYFKKIICEPNDKSKNSFVLNLSRLNEDVLIVNDRDDEALKIQKVVGKKAKIFLINGPFLKNTGYQGKTYKSVVELKAVIK